MADVFKPHDYQRVAQKHIEDNPRSGLILDMGLGKTVITLSAIRELMHETFEVERVLVIAPLKVAETTWTDEAAKWKHLRKLRISQVLGDKKKREAALQARADIYIINRENVEWLVEHLGKKGWKFDMVVIDELSSFKSPKAKRFRALKRVMHLTDRVVGLTGTPNPNGYMDLWSEVFLIDRGERLGLTVTGYRRNFFTPGKQNGNVVYSWALKPGAKEEIDRRLQDIFISMRAEDYLSLEEPIKCNRNVVLSEAERKRYRTMLKDKVLPLVEDLDGTEDKSVVAVTAAAVRNKLQQMANGFIYDEEGAAYPIHSHKIEALKELIDEANGDSVLVFYWFKEDLKTIRKALPEAVDIKDRNTAEVVAEWNRGEIPILLCHPASAGHGLNLQQGGHILIWYSLPPGHLELYAQANARLHRQGQKHVVRMYHILTEDTVDGINLKSLNDKAATQDGFIDALKAYVKEAAR